MSSWHSPGSIYNVGHRAVQELLQSPVQVQEKVDGSFFAFGVFPTGIDAPGIGDDHELRCRSKGSMIYPDAPPAMFKPAVETARRLWNEGKLVPGWTYRGETLSKPKHNSLAYDRVPEGNFILFDVVSGEEQFASYDELVVIGLATGLEIVPQLFSGGSVTADMLREFLQNDSILGGQKIEGVVIKPLEPMYGPDKKLLMAKYVSEHFREVHTKEWAKENPHGKDVLGMTASRYATVARWDKAIIHLREAGKITGDTPQDIGPCIKEIPADIWREEGEAITAEIMKWAKPHLNRLFTRGFPEYYKQRLLEQAFEQGVEYAGPVSPNEMMSVD